MKLPMIALLLVSTAVSADYLTKDSGQVIHIPEGYNACAYDEQYNPRGLNDAGEFPGAPLIDAITGKLQACEIATDFPTEAECQGGLVIGPATPDPRCKVYSE
jgi:hypothetical protein